MVTLVEAGIKGGSAHKHHWTDEEKDIIRREYRGDAESTRQLAAKLTYLSGERITFFGVKGQVQRIGVGMVKRAWTPAELEKLGELIHRYPLHEVARRLKRSKVAVKVKATRMQYGFRARDGWYTKREVCEILGVDHHKVQKWIDTGELKAAPHGEHNPKQYGMAMWHIESADLRQFIIGHAMDLTGRNVDLFTIVNLLTGGED